ncbi:MAG: S-adenosylmethionine--2-demethylmenaquinone methyltransferase, partial [Deltaproteobacteria bacterium]|nr:S-adenosylmethionine--2-demethylmenaquinone methyltransferase [Deltaproteobacteria bacterium]
MVHIIKSFPIPSDTLLGRYREQAVATVHEASGQRGALDVSIKPIARGMRICGRAVTVSCPPGDNLMLIKAISLSGPGDVIVLNSGRVANAGPFGEVLAIECLTKGINGFLTSGSVRDSQAIIALGFSVFAAGVSVRGTAKASLGTINHAICCGDVVINPGDIILGDDDGAVAIPLSEAERVLE